MQKVPFGKRATVYSGVETVREILNAGVTAKRADRAGHVHGSIGSKTVTEVELELGNLGIGNGEMLVIGKFNDQLWFTGLGSKPCKRQSILN